MAACAMSIPVAASSLGKLATTAVLGRTALRFAVPGLYQLTGSGLWKDVAGIVGLVLSAVAVHAAAAMALEDARRRTVLPLGRRNRDARRWAQGPESIDTEAPIRPVPTPGGYPYERT
jgi:uncharacterized protein